MVNYKQAKGCRVCKVATGQRPELLYDTSINPCIVKINGAFGQDKSRPVTFRSAVQMETGDEFLNFFIQSEIGVHH